MGMWGIDLQKYNDMDCIKVLDNGFFKTLTIYEFLSTESLLEKCFVS